MQRFSLAASFLLAPMGTVAAADSGAIERLIDEWVQVQSREPTGNWLLWFVMMQLLAIVSYWIASNVVMRERAFFGNAVRLWALLIVSGLCIGFLGGLASTIGFALHAPILVGLALCVTAIFILVLFVVLPMRVYEISFLRAIAFASISFLLLFAAQMAFTPLLPVPAMDAEHEAVLRKVTALSAEEREQFFRGIWRRTTHGKLDPVASAEAIAADAAKPIEERRAALKTMFDDLEKRRTSLTWGDAGALADYNRRHARYQELLAQLQSDVIEQNDIKTNQ
jgi:hypothetical protein